VKVPETDEKFITRISSKHLLLASNFLVTKAPERRRNSGHPTGTTYGFRGVLVMTSHHVVLFNLSGFNHFWLQINMKIMVNSASFLGETVFSIPHFEMNKSIVSQ